MLRYLTPRLISRSISTTSARWGEPPKKKRRIDPAILKMRVERKIRKTEREIERIESEPRQLIPIVEYELTNSEIRQLNERPQHTMDQFGLTDTIVRGANRIWSLYRLEESMMESRSISRIEKAQVNVLEKLKVLDRDLYDATLEASDTMIPYRSDHMKRETPANPDFVPPDGIIKDVTKEYVM